MSKKVTVSIIVLILIFVSGIAYLGLYNNDVIGENKALNKNVMALIENNENKKLDLTSLSKSVAFTWDEVYLIPAYIDVSDTFKRMDVYAPDKTYNSEINDVYMLAFVKYSDKLDKNKLIEYTYLPSNYIDNKLLKKLEVEDGIYNYKNRNLV